MKQDDGNHAATPGPWEISLENSGNGGFSEWWDITGNPGNVGKIWKRADALLILEAANERDRLKALNVELVAACKHVIRWLGEPSLEASENSHPAFRKALTKCRAAVAKSKEN